MQRLMGGGPLSQFLQAGLNPGHLARIVAVSLDQLLQQVVGLFIVVAGFFDAALRPAHPRASDVRHVARLQRRGLDGAGHGHLHGIPLIFR